MAQSRIEASKERLGMTQWIWHLVYGVSVLPCQLLALCLQQSIYGPDRARKGSYSFENYVSALQIIKSTFSMF